jgi:hypothetical protein
MLLLGLSVRHKVLLEVNLMVSTTKNRFPAAVQRLEDNFHVMVGQRLAFSSLTFAIFWNENIL